MPAPGDASRRRTPSPTSTPWAARRSSPSTSWAGTSTSCPPTCSATCSRAGPRSRPEAGFVVAGGHTVDDPEPKYGMAVVGEVHPDRVLTNAGLRPGDVLVLTKPLGHRHRHHRDQGRTLARRADHGRGGVDDPPERRRGHRRPGRAVPGLHRRHRVRPARPPPRMAEESGVDVDRRRRRGAGARRRAPSCWPTASCPAGRGATSRRACPASTRGPRRRHCAVARRRPDQRRSALRRQRRGRGGQGGGHPGRQRAHRGGRSVEVDAAGDAASPSADRAPSGSACSSDARATGNEPGTRRSVVGHLTPTVR